MKRVLASVLVAGLCVAGLSSVSLAGPNDNAKILVHLLAPTTKAQCTRAATLPSCNAVVATGALYPTLYFAHVLVTDGNVSAGIAGAQFGIQYNGAAGAGVDIFSWTNCATLEFTSGGWPAAGSGNLITFDASLRCQRTVPVGNDPLDGVTANLGYFYCASYTPDFLAITPRPVDNAAKVADCLANEELIGGTGYPSNVPSHLGRAAFGQSGAYNPCGTNTPVEATTWTGIKGQYGN